VYNYFNIILLFYIHYYAFVIYCIDKFLYPVILKLLTLKRDTTLYNFFCDKQKYDYNNSYCYNNNNFSRWRSNNLIFKTRAT
jgi:hypothetical protein